MVVRYRIRNTGNTRLSGTARVSAAGIGGLLRASAPRSSLPELLPGSTITRTATIDGVRPTVRVNAEVEIAPEPVGGVTGEAPLTVAATQSTWAMPWALLLLIVVALVAWRVIRRRRRPRVGDGPAHTASPVADHGDVVETEAPVGEPVVS